MDIAQTMDTLEQLGTEQNRKIYKRHGVNGSAFGVSYANLGKLHKKIKADHGLAQKLWASSNHDARVLAMMIADPNQATDKELDSWAKDLENNVIAGAFAQFVGTTPLARKKMEKWTKSKEEWIGTAGWNLMALIAARDKEIPDDYFESYLGIIEKDIHKSKNRVRYSMNGALIAIGKRNPRLQKKAIAAAGNIGRVDVDHGETGCKTPDAAEYIKKAAGHRRTGR
jgi:3-methyladenine DNA glycosylase AlkD